MRNLDNTVPFLDARSAVLWLTKVYNQGKFCIQMWYPGLIVWLRWAFVGRPMRDANANANMMRFCPIWL